MYANEFTLHVDLKKTISNKIPSFVSNDTATLFIEVTNNGEPYDTSDATGYTLIFVRPDGRSVSGLGTFENGMIKYKLGTTEMAVSGLVEVVVQIFQSESRISTKPFKIKIINDYDFDMGSDTDLTLLQELFLEVEQKGNYAQNSGDNLGYKGEYNSSTAYKKNNVVSYLGVNYICFKDTSAGILPTDGNYFTIVAPQGRFNSQTWTATANQMVFTLTSGSYVPNSNNIEIVVGGVPQTSGVGFFETNSTSFTISEPLPSGVIVFAKWIEGSVTITKTHKSSHEAGGQDELDITKLKNFNQIAKVPNEYVWTATSGQLTYVLPSNATYDPNSKWLEVTVGGAPVSSSMLQKDSPTQFTLLLNSTSIPAGVKVVARWVETYIPAISVHKGTHEEGGYDEIDVTKLKNINKFPKTSIGSTTPTDGSILWIDESVL
jgi:hypothetical protein